MSTCYPYHLTKWATRAPLNSVSYQFLLCHLGTWCLGRWMARSPWRRPPATSSQRRLPAVSALWTAKLSSLWWSGILWRGLYLTTPKRCPRTQAFHPSRAWLWKTPPQAWLTPHGAPCASASTPNIWRTGFSTSPCLIFCLSVASGWCLIRLGRWAGFRTFWVWKGSFQTNTSTSIRPKVSPAWRSQRGAADLAALESPRADPIPTSPQRFCRDSETSTGHLTTISTRWVDKTLAGTNREDSCHSPDKSPSLTFWRDWLFNAPQGQRSQGQGGG